MRLAALGQNRSCTQSARICESATNLGDAWLDAPTLFRTELLVASGYGPAGGHAEFKDAVLGVCVQKDKNARLKSIEVKVRLNGRTGEARGVGQEKGRRDPDERHQGIAGNRASVAQTPSGLQLRLVRSLFHEQLVPAENERHARPDQERPNPF